MRLFNVTLFILFNFYLIGSARGEKEGSDSVKSEKVREGKSEDEVEEYKDYEYEVGNSIAGKSEKSKNSTENPEGGKFPNEVFLTLRNITADAATAFRSFTNRNDVVDLQASASDNLNVTTNATFENAETAGINLRALRDAGLQTPPLIVEETLGTVQLPYKHTKIDTADLSDCALQGEWKPMGVAHGHLHVSSDAAHQADVLESVGSYAVPSKIIPHWQQDLGGIQDGGGSAKTSGLYSGAGAYGSGFDDGGGNSGVSNYHSNRHNSFSGGLEQFQKIKSNSMLAPPPVPPIIFGKRPGYWKLPKTKHKFFPAKGRRPGGGSYGYHSSHGASSGYGSGHFGGGGFESGSSGHGIGGGGTGQGVRGGHVHGSGAGGLLISGEKGSSHGYGSGAGVISGGEGSSHGHGGGAGAIFGSSNHGHGSGAGVISGGSSHGHGGGSGGVSISSGGSSNHGYGSGAGGYGGGDGSLSSSEGSGSAHIFHGFGGGAIAGHLIAAPGVISSSSVLGAEKDLPSGSGHAAGGNGHIISDSGDGQASLIFHTPGGGVNAGHLVSLNQGTVTGGGPEMNFITMDLSKPSGGGGHYTDSTFSSTQITQGGRNSLPDAAFLSTHINQDFAVHSSGISDDSSSSSTFTCGKNHDHNTNYHTATFQVADHDHPSSVDVLQYGGDSSVLIQSGDASFHDQILPERKHYKTSHLSDTSASGSDNRNELANGQTAQLTSQPTEDSGQVEPDPIKINDEEEPERHSYYHEITKVTKIPATSVGSVEYTFSKYETKPQTFSTESYTPQQEEPEVEPPQIIRELEHLSNKFQLDMENPQKLFEDPPSQELAYHYPFQEDDGGKVEGGEGITEFPYQFYQNKPPAYKKPIVKYIPRPAKPYFTPKHQKPIIVLRKHKPKQLIKKQNYEVQEHGGERHRPIGEIFPPQKFPKQFHNPKPNFAVDRPKIGWRPDAYQEYKYEHSHGKKVKKYKTKGKLIAAPILIRRPPSPAPIIRVVEVTG